MLIVAFLLCCCVDLNGDGTISLDEMTTYLRSVFRVLHALDPSSFDQVSASPDEVASATATQCFADADTNGDGSLRYDSCLL